MSSRTSGHLPPSLYPSCCSSPSSLSPPHPFTPHQRGYASPFLTQNAFRIQRDHFLCEGGTRGGSSEHPVASKTNQCFPLKHWVSQADLSPTPRFVYVLAHPWSPASWSDLRSCLWRLPVRAPCSSLLSVISHQISNARDALPSTTPAPKGGVGSKGRGRGASLSITHT